MGRENLRGLTLDTGALIALERNVRRILPLLQDAKDRGRRIVIPAGVLAQAWRGSARQARLAKLLNDPGVEIHPLDAQLAFAAGLLCAATSTRDVIDASVVIAARENGRLVATSDPGDLLRLDPTLQLIEL